MPGIPSLSSSSNPEGRVIAANWIREARTETKFAMGRITRVLSSVLWLVAAPGAFGVSHGSLTESLPWFKNSFLDIREDVAEAAREGRRVILYFHQDACPYCAKLLQDNFGQRAISEKTRQRFDVVSINLWGDREVTGFDGELKTEKAFGRNLQVMFTPTLLFLDEASGIILRVNGYFPPHRFDAALDYASGQADDGESFGAYFARVNPPAASGNLHRDAEFIQPPLALAQSIDDRPLLVLFEQKQCQECDELHEDILQRPATRDLLAKFRVAVVDMWSREVLQTPDGRRRAARDWARELDIKFAPSMVFFAGDGTETFRSEAYLRAFHVQSVLDYVARAAWRDYPQLQRFIQERADRLRERGIDVDIWE